MKIEETRKINEIEFQIKQEGKGRYKSTEVFFKADVISGSLSRFLRKIGFVLSIDRTTGQTVGLWTAVADNDTEYKALKETLKEYLVELP